MKFRKKPVVIDAFQWTGANPFELGDWHASVGRVERFLINGDKTLSIPTLEGIVTAQPGDYIIRGIQGEFYPCKPDIFKATYEEVVS